MPLVEDISDLSKKLVEVINENYKKLKEDIPDINNYYCGIYSEYIEYVSIHKKIKNKTVYTVTTLDFLFWRAALEDRLLWINILLGDLFGAVRKLRVILELLRIGWKYRNKKFTKDFVNKILKTKYTWTKELEELYKELDLDNYIEIDFNITLEKDLKNKLLSKLYSALSNFIHAAKYEYVIISKYGFPYEDFIEPLKYSKEAIKIINDYVLLYYNTVLMVAIAIVDKIKNEDSY